MFSWHVSVCCWHSTVRLGGPRAATGHPPAVQGPAHSLLPLLSMSRKKDKKPAQPAGGDVAARADKIRRSIAGGKSQSALQLAKKLAQESPGAASRTLLLDAYRARIRTLIDAGSQSEAAELIAFVRSKFGAEALFLAGEGERLAVRSGNLSALLREWRRGDLSEPRRDALAALLRRELADPRALAECGELPEDDPLRCGARAVCHALEETGSGPLSQESREALGVIARRSPLASWRLFVLALDAFYRSDDASSRELSARIPEDSAVARLVPILERLRTGEAAAPRDPPSVGLLMEEISGGTTGLRGMIDQLETQLNTRNHRSAIRTLRDLYARLRPREPALGLRLIRWAQEETELFDEVDLDAVLTGLLPERERLRLLALAVEPEDTFEAYASWSIWLMSFGRKSWPDEAQWLAFIDHFSPIASQVDEEFEGSDFAARLPYLERRLASLSPRQMSDDDIDAMCGLSRITLAELVGKRVGRALRPDRLGEELLRIAIEMQPTAPRFRRLLQVAEGDEDEAILTAWSLALPDDVEPLLKLADRCSRRYALKKALKLLDRARQIAPMNEEVRAGHFRVLVAILLRHGKACNWRLFARDLEKLASLPAASRPDHRLFLAGCRCHLAEATGAEAELERERQELAKTLGRAASVPGTSGSSALVQDVLGLITAILSDEHAHQPLQLRSTDPASELRSRAILWKISSAIGGKATRLLPPISPRARFRPEHLPGEKDDLLALCAQASGFRHLDLLHLASGAGLRAPGRHLPLFAFYRWQALQGSGIRESRDARECRELATCLARRSGDTSTLQRILDGLPWFLSHSFDDLENLQRELPPREIERRLERERFLFCDLEHRDILRGSATYQQLMHQYGGEKLDPRRRPRRRQRRRETEETSGPQLRQRSLFEEERGDEPS
ncbi:MAG: hypothetical protein AB1486_19400 [Planctomycetota bacterium]